MAEIVLEGVRKSRPAPDGGAVEVLQGISLRIPAGELTAVIGPSGGGKSTLVRLLNRLEDPDEGILRLDGRDLRRLDPLELRRRVALVPQKPFLFPESVLRNLQHPYLFRGEAPPPADSPQIEEVLALCRLEKDLLERQGRTLSLGQQQRVALARALMIRPQVLLLDEPTSALDRPTGDRLAETLREICRSVGLTILMVTHDLRLAGRVADRLAYLEGGRILEEGMAAEMLRRPRSPELRAFLDQPADAEVLP